MASAAVTRFAPSPTGLLHLGHALAAGIAWQAARPEGLFLVRIEDIDTTRCQPEFEKAIFDDLRWLGLTWPEPVLRQSGRNAAYGAALERLKQLGVLYPCFCTRREIASAASAPQGDAPPVYPGTCRLRSPAERADLMASGAPYAWRLDASAASKLTGPLKWLDRRAGWQPVDLSQLGDVVLGRKEIPTSYHLSVTLDDAAQNISLVTRGEDLFASTHIHRLLQELLGLPVPEWHHHRLMGDENGKRLAKRDAARSLRSYRDAGLSSAAVWNLIGLPLD